jgi:hypothetical protein
METSMNIQWSPEEEAILNGFKTTADVQDWLDTTAYSTEPIYRGPRSVMRDRRAHCFDGAVFAAAALERLGFPPLLVDLQAVRDDDHVLAVFRVDGHWGAVAKSNFVGLRYRDPIFRSLRELGLSYFEGYYNLDYERSLRAVSRPLDLRRFDGLSWRVDDRAMEEIAAALNRIRHTPLMSASMPERLRRVDERTYRGNMYGTDMAGVVTPAEAEAKKEHD